MEKSNLEHDDLINMLKALSAIGKIVWSDEPLRKETIFHKIEDLSVFLKAIFTHESEIALSFFAILMGMEKQAIQQQLELVRSKRGKGIGDAWVTKSGLWLLAKRIDYSLSV